MIITPKTQLSLPFQNNVIDNGLAGLSWTPQGNGAKFTDGKFGRAYEFESPSNGLRTGLTTNPFNITNEFTFYTVFQKGGSVQNANAFCLMDLGKTFSTTEVDNVGLIMHITDGNNLEIRVEQSFAGGWNGGNLGRWRTKFQGTWTIGNWYLVVARRTNSAAKVWVYDFDEEELDIDTLSFSGSDLDNWGNRSNNIGILAATDESILRGANSGAINTAQVYNKAIPESDAMRLFHGLHPISI